MTLNGVMAVIFAISQNSVAFEVYYMRVVEDTLMLLRQQPNVAQSNIWRYQGRSQPPPHQLGGLGKRCELLQRGSGRSPGRPAVFLHFECSGWLLL